MATPDIPGAKRAGLAVDFERIARVGDADLTPEERYALKTHGVCAQLQDHVFMIRVRVPGGRLQPDQARALVGMARYHARDWVHLTTRQNVELHWVSDRSVPAVLAEVDGIGPTTRSACGHTLRNVMSAEEAGVGLDEPFDRLPDARAVSAAIVGPSRALHRGPPPCSGASSTRPCWRPRPPGDGARVCDPNAPSDGHWSPSTCPWVT